MSQKGHCIHDKTSRSGTAESAEDQHIVYMTSRDQDAESAEDQHIVYMTRGNQVAEASVFRFEEVQPSGHEVVDDPAGIYYTVFKLQDHLRGKFFETECDHNNLRWMESSSNAAVTRMRVFL